MGFQLITVLTLKQGRSSYLDCKGIDNESVEQAAKWYLSYHVWPICDSKQFVSIRPLLNPIWLGGPKSTHSAWAGGSICPPLKSRRWGQKSPRLWLHIDIWSIKDFLSHLRARYDKKWKNRQSKSENPEKKSKIFGLKNFELDMLDTVFRPQEHDAIG